LFGEVHVATAVYETVVAHAREPHNEHLGCSLCGSYAVESTGSWWQRAGDECARSDVEAAYTVEK
jgi:hypothetical protein